jgi:hypothetical protein
MKNQRKFKVGECYYFRDIEQNILRVIGIKELPYFNNIRYEVIKGRDIRRWNIAPYCFDSTSVFAEGLKRVPKIKEALIGETK